MTLDGSKEPKNTQQKAKDKLGNKDAIHYHYMAGMLRADHLYAGLEVPETFHLIRINHQHDEIVQEIDGICYPSNMKRVAQAVLRHTRSHKELKLNTKFAWDYDKCMKAARHWEATTKAKERPAYVKFKSDPGLTFHRLPFDLPKSDEMLAMQNCPTFLEILSRMSNEKAFTSWLGSLFYPESDKQQYVWMYGEGQNGKGSVAELIRYLFGDAYFAAAPPARDDKFWSYFLINRRVICFPDCNDNNFITSGFFKSLTGGDAVKVEQKGGSAFTVKLDCKYIINSNDKPAISGSTADRRRAIFCELSPIRTETDPKYLDRLKNEAPWILAYCMSQYINEYPNHGRLKVDDEVMDELIEENEDHLEALFNNFFVQCTKENGIRPDRMQKLLDAHFPRKNERLKFKKYIQRHPWVDYRQTKLLSGNNERAYLGIKEARDGKNVTVM